MMKVATKEINSYKNKNIQAPFKAKIHQKDVA